MHKMQLKQLAAAMLAMGTVPAMTGPRQATPAQQQQSGPDGFAEVKTLLTKQNEAWEQFKRENDTQIKAIKDGQAGVVADQESKLAKINAELAQIGKDVKDAVLAAQRPGNAPAGEDTEKELKSFNKLLAAQKRSPFTAEQYAAYKAATDSYIRKGMDGMTAEEVKAINVGTDPQGGYLVGSTVEAGIDRVVRRYSGLRTAARVIPIGTAEYKKLVKTGGTSGASRGGETAAPTEGSTPNWAELTFRPGTYLSDQRITQEALEDAVQDVEADLIEEIGIEFAELEGADFFSGSGVNAPRGIASYPMVDNSAYAWGSVGFIVTGAAASFAASNPSDKLIDLQHALKRQYRVGAQWMMNDATLGAIRKFKDGQGIYLWAPSGLQNGAIGQLLGYSVITDDFTDDLGANKYPVWFGDFNRAYYVIDRKGISILRDPFSAVPYVKFIARRRVGGGIANFEAVKALKCST
jgi:HK97 family phage major capsid protein